MATHRPRLVRDVCGRAGAMSQKLLDGTGAWGRWFPCEQSGEPICPMRSSHSPARILSRWLFTPSKGRTMGGLLFFRHAWNPLQPTDTSNGETTHSDHGVETRAGGLKTDCLKEPSLALSLMESALHHCLGGYVSRGLSLRLPMVKVCR